MPQERPIQSIPSTRPARSTGAPRWLVPVLVAGVVAATAGYFIGVAGHPDPQASAAPVEEPESAAALESGSELEVVSVVWARSVLVTEAALPLVLARAGTGGEEMAAA